MKINIIENVRIPTEKAHGYQISKMCEEYSNLENEVNLILPGRENSIKDDLFKFYNLKNNFIVRYLKISKIFFKLNSKYKFKILSLYFYFKLFFKNIDGDLIITRDPCIVFLFKLKRKKVFLEAHYWPEKKRKLYSFCIKKADKIICNSKGTAQKYKEVGLKNIIVAPNGVDLEKFNMSKNKEELRRELELPKDKKIIMYVGHLYKWKGIDMMIDVAEKLKNNKEIIFIVIGGIKNDIEKYQNIIKNKNINNLLFLGYKKKDKIPTYLKSSDLLLLPNVPVSNEAVEYTSPIKMFEYMASQRIIVASDLPSIKEILNNENSVLFKAGDSDDLLKKINRIFEMREDDREKIIKRAFSDVQNYTWEKRARKILDFLKV